MSLRLEAAHLMRSLGNYSRPGGEGALNEVTYERPPTMEGVV